MARAIWTGYISFGLVTVPVKLYSAVRSHAIHFRQIHETTGARVRRKRVDAETGEEVPYSEIAKGYEVGKDEYILVDPDELKELDPEASRMIDIRDFVDLADIPPIYYDRPYWLAPADESAVRPYALLVEAMDRSERVAVAKFVMRTKEYLAAIRPKDGHLVLSTMNYADEIVDPADIEDLDRGDVATSEREVEMAERLIDSLTTDFDPTAYRDTYQERVREFLEQKAAGQEPTFAPPERERGEVVDLMEALEQSLRGQPQRQAPQQPLQELTKEKLYELAQERDIAGRSQMTKEELIDALSTENADREVAS